MRFFKAFSLLHRRTKSETFIPGCIPPNQGSFAISNLNSRPSSVPAGLGYSPDTSEIFDFVTAKFTPVSANFNHLRGVSHVASPHRRSGRHSQNGLSSLLAEENMRLRDSLNMWFSEYSKADKLLQECRAELDLERDNNRTLQQQTARDQELIGDLKKDISRYEKRFDNSRDPSSLDCCSGDTSNDSHNTLLLPGSSYSATSLVISKRIRTLDEYTSALRMTLSTRRHLRDQKKVSKFWKNIALSTGKCEDIITPSTSAISSVHDPLPPERKRAINALMRERGWPYPQVQSVEPKHIHLGASELPSEASLSGDQSVSRIYPVSSIAATMSTSSNNSVGFRLAPLASESLKAEINILFGSQRSEKALSSPPKKAVLSSTASKTMGESPSRLSNILNVNSLTFSFGSFGDLSQRFSNLFSQDHGPRVKLPVTVTPPKDDLMQNAEPNRAPLSSSCLLAESSVPSGSSRIFGEALALLQGQHDANMGFNFQPVNIDREEIKPLKSDRSRNYVVPAAKQIPSKIGVLRKKVFVGKENMERFSRPLYPT